MATPRRSSTPAATGIAVTAKSALANHPNARIPPPLAGRARRRRSRSGCATQRAYRRSGHGPEAGEVAGDDGRAAAPPACRRRTPSPLSRGAARPMRARNPSSASSGRERRPRTSSARPSTTNPVSPSTTASCDPPLRPATAGTPAAAASRNTIPNPSASSPPHRSRHGIANTSAHAYSCGNDRRRARGRGTASGRRRRVPRPALEPRPSRPAPAIASCTSGRARDRVDQHVEPLPRHQPAHAEHERPVGIEPERARGPRARARRRRAGTEAIDVDARRHHHPAQRAARGTFRLARRIVARRRRRPRRRAAPGRRAAGCPATVPAPSPRRRGRPPRTARR